MKRLFLYCSAAKVLAIRSLLVLSLSIVLTGASYAGKLNSGCSPQKVGLITNSGLWRAVPDFLEQLTKYFPVDTFEHRAVPFTGPSTAYAMDEKVNELKDLGINKIIVAAFSIDTRPFILGDGTPEFPASHIRHPEVTFSAVAQGDSSIDEGINWIRAGLDFKTNLTVAPVENLPTLDPIASPATVFILATDNSEAVQTILNVPYRNRADIANYQLIDIDLNWVEGDSGLDPITGAYLYDPIPGTYTNMSELDNTIADILENTNKDIIVGISMTTAGDPGWPNISSPRYIDFTTQAKSNFSHIFNDDAVASPRVSYLAVSYEPAKLSLNGMSLELDTLPVDLLYGASSVSELVADPKGVNRFLIKLGFPDNRVEAELYGLDVDRDGNGITDGIAAWNATFPPLAFFATCGKRNLDRRFAIDQDGHRIDFYLEDSTQVVGQTSVERDRFDLRVNPRWCEALATGANITKTKYFKKYCKKN